MAALGQRGHFVQEALGPGDDLIAASRVVAAALGLAADGVGAVQGVIQAAPAGVGGVERVAGVHDGHDQLRAGHLGDGVIDVGGVDGEVGAFGHQIADLGQEGLVGGHVLDGTGVGAVPVVELLLDVVTLGQQGAVLGAQVVDEAGQALPEGVGADAGAGQSLLDQVMKGGGHLQAESFDTMGHGSLRGIDESVLRTGSFRSYGGIILCWQYTRPSRTSRRGRAPFRQAGPSGARHPGRAA